MDMVPTKGIRDSIEGDFQQYRSRGQAICCEYDGYSFFLADLAKSEGHSECAGLLVRSRSCQRKGALSDVGKKGALRRRLLRIR
jgi:hypothetical protein